MRNRRGSGGCAVGESFARTHTARAHNRHCTHTAQMLCTHAPAVQVLHARADTQVASRDHAHGHTLLGTRARARAQILKWPRTRDGTATKTSTLALTHALLTHPHILLSVAQKSIEAAHPRSTDACSSLIDAHFSPLAGSLLPQSLALQVNASMSNLMVQSEFLIRVRCTHAHTHTVRVPDPGEMHARTHTQSEFLIRVRCTHAHTHSPSS